MHEVAIAGLILRQQNEAGASGAGLAAARRKLRAVAEIDRELNADDRLDAVFRKLFGKLQRAEQAVGVGDRQRRHRIGQRKFGEPCDRQSAFPQREGAMHMQMDEAYRPMRIIEPLKTG